MTDLVFDTDGPIISRDGDVNDFISAGWDARADRLVIPVSRLAPDFFAPARLRLRVQQARRRPLR